MTELNLKRGAIYVQAADVKNPQPDRRMRDPLAQPVIKAGTRWMAIRQGGPAGEALTLRMIDTDHPILNEISPWSSRQKTDREGNRIGPTLWSLVVGSLCHQEVKPQGARDHLAVISELTPHRSDGQFEGVLDVLIDTGKITAEGLERAVEIMNNRWDREESAR